MGRCVFIMLDGVGVGALPDAAEYGDTGSDTVGNLSRLVDLHLPNFTRLGLGNIAPVIGVPPVSEPLSLVGRLAPLSAGKDSTVGHWEHMGLVTAEPFPTYPQGFPEELVGRFSAAIGRSVLGNKPASGTAIIAELGEEHVATGWPIVYTSADSVFQVAAHVDVVPLEQLYSWCEIARDLMGGQHGVARVIARPFKGPAGSFVRTKDRRDFSLAPTGPTYLDVLQRAGVPVLALGKIGEVFANKGIATNLKAATNEENLALIIALLRGRSSRATFRQGLLLTNLVDFDMVWGHRNDVDGFARSLEEVDTALPAILETLRSDDLLILTADHGVDPTTPSTDHSREYVPLVVYPRPKKAPGAVYEGTFADTGATLCQHLTGQEPLLGGDVVARLVPSRGWRRYTPVQATLTEGAEGLPGRVGPEEAADAATWLEASLGPAPDVAVVLGSGLAPGFPAAAVAEVAYEAVPWWISGGVPGHPQVLTISEALGQRVALLKGRAHSYEGYDLSEVQLQVRSLAAWGVRRLVLTSASGAVADGVLAGDLVLVDEVLDLQHAGADGFPARLRATEPGLLSTVGTSTSGFACAIRGLHACVPGPQYETSAELAVLREMGATTVSMSLGAEVRAARECSLVLAVMAVVTNVGCADHEQVLAAASSTSGALTSTLEAVLSMWGANASGADASLY